MYVYIDEMHVLSFLGKTVYRNFKNIRFFYINRQKRQIKVTHLNIEQKKKSVKTYQSSNLYNWTHVKSTVIAEK